VTPAAHAGISVAVQPDEFSFNIMVNAYARAKQVDPAFKMLLEMRRANCSPDKITYSTLIKACVATGQMVRAYDLLAELVDLGMQDAFAYNTVLAGLAKRKQWREVRTATRYTTLQHTATHCNTVLAGLAKRKQWREVHTATHCNALQHTATHCNTLQHRALRVGQTQTVA